MQYPLQVILSILGLPESDYPRMLKLTQELFGAADPEIARGQTLDDLAQVINDFFVYFTALTEERRAHPTDDLASAIANATIDGEPLGIMETISYYVIVATVPNWRGWSCGRCSPSCCRASNRSSWTACPS